MKKPKGFEAAQLTNDLGTPWAERKLTLTLLYKERNKVERCVGLFKQFRRVATRYKKTARNFLGVVCLVATTIWLR